MSNNEILPLVLICGVIVLVITGLQYQYASAQKGKTSMKKPGKVLSFTTLVPIEQAMKTIIHFAQSNGYKVDDFNESQSIIVLSDSPTMGSIAFANSGGFIYPIYLSKQINNSILVEVGIKHKMLRLGNPPTAPLEKCCNGIKAAIFATT